MQKQLKRRYPAQIIRLFHQELNGGIIHPPKFLRLLWLIDSFWEHILLLNTRCLLVRVNSRL
jgi:hypothetical protein